jgi:glycine betaine/proline transport system permease protein
VAPGIRYPAAGLRGVRPGLLEGARLSGCTPWRLVWQVMVPLALPTILLGLNQVIMMAFGMLVITALVGTRGLEETTLVAISRVNPGDGLLAGLSIAGMAIVFDRLVKAINRRLAHQLGLPPPA